jgi:hypothetical protein
MPARIVVVLDEPGFAEKAADELKAAGYYAIALPDSMAAVDAVQEQCKSMELLITCPEFQPGKPTGISVARMARYRRRDIKALFIGPDNLAQFTADLGAYLTPPVTVQQVVEEAVHLLNSDEPEPPGAA